VLDLDEISKVSLYDALGWERVGKIYCSASIEIYWKSSAEHKRIYLDQYL